MRRRRAWIAAGLGLLSVGGVVAGLRPLLREKIESAARARLNLPVRVGSVELGLSTVRLHRVAVGARDRELEARVDEVQVAPGPLSLLIGGVGSVDALTLSGVEVRIHDLGAVGRRLDRGPGGEGAAGPAHSSPSRAVVVRDLNLTIEDSAGELGTVAGSTISLDASGHVRGSGLEIRIGASETGELVLEGVEATAELSGGLRLRRLDIGEGHLAVPLGDLGDRGTAARLRHVWSEWMGHRDDQNQDVLVSDAGAPVDAAVSDAAVVGASAGLAGAATGLGDAVGRAMVDGLGRLAGASISASNFEVRVRGESERVALRELFARAQIGSGGELQLTGHGLADTGGALRWDLRLQLAEARAEGTVAASELPLDLFGSALGALPLTHAERGRLSFHLDLTARGSAIDLSGDLTVANLEVSSPRIAAHPVSGISLAAAGQAVWVPGARRLTISEAQLRSGDATVRLSGSVEAPPGHYAADLVATLPPTACEDALSGIPRDLLDDVADFSLEGRIAGRVALELDSRRLAETRLAVRIADGCRFVSVPALADLRRVAGPFVHRVREPDGSVFEMSTGPGTDAWTPIGAISPLLVHAVVAHEDSSFFRHAGFAPWAIRDALVRDLDAGHFVTGASTITMQLAKNLFLQREKTLARKAQEVILTWWLEAAKTKQEILELYLNLIEYGPGIYGIRNASLHYFGKEPVDLSLAESAFLASILPAPKRFHAMYVSGRLTRSMTNRMRRLMERMLERGRVDDVALADGMRELADFRFAAPGARVSHERVGGFAPLSWSSDEELDGDEVVAPEDGRELDEGMEPDATLEEPP